MIGLAHGGTRAEPGAGCNREREAPDARSAQDGVTGERMTVSTSNGGVIDSYEPVLVPSHFLRVRGETALSRRNSVQPTRRALLRIRAAGDPPVPPDLASWFTQRAFHFYVTGLRLPGPGPIPVRRPARRLKTVFTDLDAACAHMRAADGIDYVIAMASGQSAAAVALWRHARQQDSGGHEGGIRVADALILNSPAFPPRTRLSLDIACPVLVLTAPATRQRRPPWRHPAATAIQLGRHVTWLQLACGSAADSPDSGAYFDQLGRWLGAYMYGQGRDRLL